MDFSVIVSRKQDGRIAYCHTMPEWVGNFQRAIEHEGNQVIGIISEREYNLINLYAKLDNLEMLKAPAHQIQVLKDEIKQAKRG